MKRCFAILAFAVLASALWAGNASAAFGLHELGAEFSDGTGPASAAGSHPSEFTTSFKLNTTVAGNEELLDGELKDLEISQIPGLVGSQTAVPRCSLADFNDRTESRPACSDSTVVGIAAIKGEFGTVPVGTEIFVHAPVYNLAPSRGSAAKLGFVVLNVPIVIDVGVSQKPPYNLIATLGDSPQSIQLYGSLVTLWSDPASPSHDALRGNCLGEPTVSTAAPVSLGSCPSQAPERAFLTLPRACPGPINTLFRADSWAQPGLFTEPEAAVPSFAATGCGDLGFDPSIEAAGSNQSAESPSGLDFDLRVNDPGLEEPAGLADSDIERAVVTLPEGFTTNPSVASGLGACTLGQYEAEASQFSPTTGCPQSSKVGSVEVSSPLLEEKVDGEIFVAKQGENVFHSLLTLYMILRNEQNGILIKQPIKVDPDSQTGRLTTTVAEIPQLPFSDFHLHFDEGPRAPLISPATCGSFQVTAQLTPYANPSAPVIRTADLNVSSGAGGSACAATPANQPSTRDFTAGTVDPSAGAYSPFVLHLSRPDGSQQISSISAGLPRGLLGKLAGIPYCSDSQIAAAGARSGEGQGAQETASPSCPAASEVGTVTVTAGAGPEPLSVGGHAYLAGPYKGAPLSLEIITPAIAGPFDLGTVAVRTALEVDPFTSQITAVSDPIPTILHGLPLDVRSISINMSRPQFTLNPTSCEPKAITANVVSTLGSITPLSQYFQAANCAALGFKPTLKLQLTGSTKRTAYPGLKAVLTYPSKGAYANIARAQVALPQSEFFEQGNLDKVCQQAELRSATCPKSSIYGHAKAWSPLLDKPLEGPVYLGVGFGYKLPALVADLNGQIRILLKGRVDATKDHGLRNTFEAVPDAPMSRFVLQLKGGKKYGLLRNSIDLCSKPQKANARFVAQNGRIVQVRPTITRSCGKAMKKR